MEAGDPADPLARQVRFDPAELCAHPGDLLDPVGEGGCSPVPLVVRKHRDRVLLLVTRRCFGHCRYCFRRVAWRPDDPSEEEVERAVAWARESGSAEVVLSGGDPLCLADVRLLGIVDALRPAIPVVRLHTRAPVFAPERITPALVRALAERAPLWVVVHVNCATELTPEVDAALGALVDAGLPVLAQAVLLRGVNDRVEALVELCQALVRRRISPYYLHHPDAVAGNAHLRVPLERGLELVGALSRRVSGVALPRYVVDAPDGSGKVDAKDWAQSEGCLDASSSAISQS